MCHLCSPERLGRKTGRGSCRLRRRCATDGDTLSDHDNVSSQSVPPTTVNVNCYFFVAVAVEGDGGLTQIGSVARQAGVQSSNSSDSLLVIQDGPWPCVCFCDGEGGHQLFQWLQGSREISQ